MLASVTPVKTANYTAVKNEIVRFDTTSGPLVLTLPTGAADGDVVGGKIVTQGGSNGVTVNCSGSDTINKTGGVTTFTLTLLGQAFLAKYRASDATWTVTDDDLPLSQLDARYVATAAAVTLSNTAPANATSPAGASSGTSASAMRADAAIGVPGLYALPYGRGEDGTVVFDGTSTITGWTRSGTTYTAQRPADYLDVTVNSGVTIIPAGWIMNVAGTLTNNGTIHTDGGNAAGATAGAMGGNNSGNLNPGGVGAAGTTGVGAQGGVPTGLFGGTVGNTNSFAGSGGAGGAGTPNAGGAARTQAGATVTLTNYPWNRAIARAIYAFQGITPYGPNTQQTAMYGGSGGSSGGGDGTNAGGGGGGGGGCLVLNARRFTNNGSVHCNGGNGAAGVGGNAGGGGGGGGGVLIVNTSEAVTGSGTFTATAGAAGAGVGTGSAGSAGTAGFVQTAVWS